MISPGLLTSQEQKKRDPNQEDPSESTIKQGYVTPLIRQRLYAPFIFSYIRRLHSKPDLLLHRSYNIRF